MTDDQIREIFLSNGFTIKAGETDLKPYMYAAARELLAAAGTTLAKWDGVIRSSDFIISTYWPVGVHKPSWTYKPDYGVLITHTPTGEFKMCHADDRSAHRNQATAMTELQEVLKFLQ